MAHKFVIRDNDELIEFDKFEDIPESFDHLIKFLPEIPVGPHTHDEHDEIAQWNEKLKEIMKREKKNASGN